MTSTTDRERIRTVIVDDPDALAVAIAARIAALIRARGAEGRRTVLGLATGSTPVGVYRELIRLHRDEGLSFRGVETFNLDEYYPMSPDSIHSYHRFMWENFFSRWMSTRPACTSPGATCRGRKCRRWPRTTRR